MESDTDTGSLPSKVGPFVLGSRCSSSDDATTTTTTPAPAEATTRQTTTTINTRSNLPHLVDPEQNTPYSFDPSPTRLIPSPTSCSNDALEFAGYGHAQPHSHSHTHTLPLHLAHSTMSSNRSYPRGTAGSRAHVLPVSPLRQSDFFETADATPTPIRGDFIPVGSPTRHRSPSPSRDDSSGRGVTLHLSLTDSQMDRLTEVISRPPSPERGTRRGRHGPSDQQQQQQRAHHVRAYSEDEIIATPAAPSFQQDAHSARAHSQQPRRAGTTTTTHSGTTVTFADRVGGSSRSRSPTKQQRHHARADSYPDHDMDRSTVSSIAQRRGVPHPSVDTTTAQRQGSPSHRRTPIEILRQEESHREQQQRSYHGENNRASEYPSSSIYSVHQEQQYDDDEWETIVPLSPTRTHQQQQKHTEADVQRSLAEYESLFTKNMRPMEQPDEQQQQPNPALLSVKTGTGHVVENFARVYSPLTPYIESMDDKIPRRKVLIGEHGWLERTNALQSQPSQQHGQRPPQQQQPQKRGILESIKKVAKEVVEKADLKAARAAAAAAAAASTGPSARRRAPTRLDISLDPREQSLFYCELEFLMTTALDTYLTAQFNAGRLVADKLGKVAAAWRQKGRPRVVGFRYDVETQVDLVLLHLYDFKFYGGVDACAAAAVTGVLEMVRGDARAMRVRTFCQPDLVMAKQLLDAQKLFNILGCREALQMQLHEVVRFFKLVLSRERAGVGGGQGREEQQQRGRRDGGQEQQQQQKNQQQQRRWQSQSPRRHR